MFWFFLRLNLCCCSVLKTMAFKHAQQSKEMAGSEQDKLAKRIQEFRTQEEIANVRMASNVDTSTSGDGIHVVGLQSYKTIEALMQSTANGEVTNHPL